jgi:hypothetical protein
MIRARNRLKRVPAHWRGLFGWSLVLILSLATVPTTSNAATTNSPPTRDVAAIVASATQVRHAALRHRILAIHAELADFTSDPTPADGLVVRLIHQDFPHRAWHAAEAVAWCESKFHASEIGYDSNGTHDRGLFQLNDGGTEQYLMAMLHKNPNNLNLAFNPVLNVRAAALLFRRDGWSQWSCESAI